MSPDGRVPQRHHGGMCEDWSQRPARHCCVCSHERPRWESDMAEPVPVTELSAFSSPNATPTEWSRARGELADAEVYWLSTVRPDGRPHVTPLLAIWLEGALYFCTGPDERKAKNLSANCHCVLTTGRSTLEGLDLVIEGTAEGVTDHAELARIANTYESKYGPHFVAPDGTWSGLGDAIRRAEVLVYRVSPETALDLAKEEVSVKRAGGSRVSPDPKRRARATSESSGLIRRSFARFGDDV